MKAGRRGKFIYMMRFNSQRQFKVLYIMHEVSENRKAGEDSED